MWSLLFDDMNFRVFIIFFSTLNFDNSTIGLKKTSLNSEMASTECSFVTSFMTSSNLPVFQKLAKLCVKRPSGFYTIHLT